MIGKQHRTPLARVRGLGSARSGTADFWRLRFTAVVNVPLTIAFVLIVVALLGRNHAAAQQILGTPLVAIIILLFIGVSVDHMRLGMQTIIEDYVHDEIMKFAVVMLNTFFAIAIGLSCAYAIFKLSFGV